MHYCNGSKSKFILEVAHVISNKIFTDIIHPGSSVLYIFVDDTVVRRNIMWMQNSEFRPKTYGRIEINAGSQPDCSLNI